MRSLTDCGGVEKSKIFKGRDEQERKGERLLVSQGAESAFAEAKDWSSSAEPGKLCCLT